MFPYPGGKSKISKWIIPHFPHHFDVYVEPFGGAFWMYLKMECTPTNVIYNDLNVHLVNFFECARTDPRRLSDLLQGFPSEDKNMFLHMRSIFFDECGGMNWCGSRPDYEVATMFLYLQTHLFVGHQLTPTARYQHIDTSRWSSRYQAVIRKLTDDSYIQRLSSISTTENLDFRRLIEKYDDPNVFWYFDPPYFSTEHYYTEGQFGLTDHEDLADMLGQLKGKFALSYYVFDKLHEWYPQDRFKWVCSDFTAPMSAGANLARLQRGHGRKVDVAKHKATELLILNYDTSEIKVEVKQANTEDFITF